MDTESIYDKKADLLSGMWDNCRVETPMELGENMYRVWLDGFRFLYVSDEGDSFHILGLSNTLLPKAIYNTAPSSAHSAEMQNILRNYQKSWNIQTEEDLSECTFWYFKVHTPNKSGYVEVFGKNYAHALARLSDSGYLMKGYQTLAGWKALKAEDRVLIDTIVYF
jgi:hypothetical protein